MEQDLYLHSEALDALIDPEIARLPREKRINTLRFGLAVTYDDLYGWRTWTRSAVDLLWAHMTAPDVRVVGWDIYEYDIPILRHTAQRDDPIEALDLSAEILAATQRHYRLDIIARANLKRGKIIDTQLIIDWLRNGDPASMIRATEYCRNHVQLVIDLYDLAQRGQPLLLPGRLHPTESGWLKTNEATLRLFFTPDGNWQRIEDLRGQVLSARPESN